MIVQVKREIVEEIDITLPYYYERDKGSPDYNCVVFGRIDDNQHQSVKLYSKPNERSAELKSELTDISSLERYFNPIYQSTKERFDAAVSRALNLLSRFQ